MAEERKQPIRAGIVEMLRNSTSFQYVIPVNLGMEYKYKMHALIEK